MKCASSRAFLRMIRLIVAALLSVCVCTVGAQQTQNEKPKPQEGQQPSASKHTFEELAAEANKHSFQDILNKDPDAVRNIEEIFAATSQTELKQRVASILMRIGVRDPVYFNFLAGEAKKALEIDMPWAELYDDKTGKATAVNPAFVRWCEKHHRDQYDAFEEARYTIPRAWMYLASAGDPRAYDLLVQGLHAENNMIVWFAALGLAKLQDPRAIDELIGASHQAKDAGIRFGFAQALWYFPNDGAQTAGNVLAQEFVAIGEARLGKKLPLAQFRDEFTKGGPKDILSFEGLLAPDSILMPPPANKGQDPTVKP